MEIGLSEARADIKESGLFALQSIVFNGERQLWKFHLALFVGATNVFIDVLIDCQKCGKWTARYFTISKRRFAFILPGLTRFQIDLIVFPFFVLFSVVLNKFEIVSCRPKQTGKLVYFFIHEMYFLLEFVIGQHLYHFFRCATIFGFWQGLRRSGYRERSRLFQWWKNNLFLMFFALWLLDTIRGLMLLFLLCNLVVNLTFGSFQGDWACVFDYCWHCTNLCKYLNKSGKM